METPSRSAIQIKDSQLHFSSFGGGTTVWFLQKLEGSVMIEYNATAMPIGGVADVRYDNFRVYHLISKKQKSYNQSIPSIQQ